MAPKTSIQKEKIFLVDDHPLVREWLTNLINQQPDLAVCAEADTASEALRAIMELQPGIAIVDISLKGSSGIELVKELDRCCPSVTVLVLSMHEELYQAQRALHAGAKGYIVERETSRKVIGAIRQVLEGKPYLSDDLAAAMKAEVVKRRTPYTQTPAESLGRRELQVFELLGQGRGTRQIAEMIHLSIKTVENHCAHIKEKLNLASGTELLREAVRWWERPYKG